MATRYWGQHMGYGHFEYFNPCVTNGKLDDVSQIPAVVEQTEKYADDFRAAWDKWIGKGALCPKV